MLASYLKNEYPQTVAVILSKLKPDHAARVLAELPRDLSIVVFAAKRLLSVDLYIDYVRIDSASIGSAAVAMLGAMIGQRGTQPNRAIPMPYVAAGSTAPPRS